ncbi:MAG: hypothetical protein VW891_08850 [Novosphingobium sp.]|jgi:hypothetical protein
MRLARRTFIAASAALSASAALAAPTARGGSLLLLADDHAALGWLRAMAAEGSHPAAVALAHGPADAMERVAAHLTAPGARVLTLLASPAHLLAQIALRDAGAHQYLDLDRAGDLLGGPSPALQLHRATGLSLAPSPAFSSPTALAGRSLLAGVMECPR